MKISQGMRIGREVVPSSRERSPADPASFQGMMREQGKKLTIEQLHRLITEIDRQGERLAKHRTIEELRKYKELVQQFIHEAVKHGVGLEERSGFNLRGRERRWKILKEIDKRLLELTQEWLEKNEKTIDILARIGEIKGLLLNLYF